MTKELKCWRCGAMQADQGKPAQVCRTCAKQGRLTWIKADAPIAGQPETPKA